MRKQTYGDKQREAQQQKKQEELREKAAPKPVSDDAGKAAKKTQKPKKSASPA
jgi:hypothetical protein